MSGPAFPTSVARDVSCAPYRFMFRDTTAFYLMVLQALIDDTRGSRIETPIRTRNEMFAENLMQVSDVDIVVFPPLTCVPHTRTGQEGPLASPFARKSGPAVALPRLSLMQ